MPIKNCIKCRQNYTTLFRVKFTQSHYSRKEWVFACENCVIEVKKDNPIYKYGGTWKGFSILYFFFLNSI